MTAINWNDALNFGVEELDGEHQALIDAVNQIDALHTHGGARQAITEALDELLAVAARHIANEHDLLERHGFSDSPAHAAADRKFVRILENVAHVFEEHDSLTPETVDFIRHLVLQHILETDKPLRTFFRQRRGLEPAVAPYLHWLDSFNIGVLAIDRDHRRFIEIINAMKEALSRGGGRQEIAALLDAFADHAVDHTRREEAMLERLNYPSSAVHKAEHDDLIAALVGMRDRFQSGAAPFETADLLLIIKEWIIHHILFVDMRMKSFLEVHADELPRAGD